jgi:hypothetical protein
VVGQPECQAARILEPFGAWQDVQGVHKVADQLQVPWSRQAAVFPIGCHTYILSCLSKSPRPERRRQDQQGRQP